jgi:hypothetical protein
MGTSTTVATGRFGALARLMVALGFAAAVLAGQAVVFDSPVAAKDALDDEYEGLCQIVDCNG